MSDIINEVGLFRFINRTRYNSEDICHIMRVFEDTALKHGAPADKPYHHSQYRVMAGMVYDFGEYQPKVIGTRRQDGYVNGQRFTRTVVDYINGPGYSTSTKWKINILPPHRLSDNPMENLIAGHDFAPDDLTQQLTNVIMGLFRTNVDYRVSNAINDEVRRVLFETKDPHRIRIMPRRESAVSSAGRKKRVEAGQARAAYIGTRENLREAVKSLVQACSRLKDLEEHSSNISFEMPTSPDRLASLLNDASIILGRMDRGCAELDVAP